MCVTSSCWCQSNWNWTDESSVTSTHFYIHSTQADLWQQDGGWGCANWRRALQVGIELHGVGVGVGNVDALVQKPIVQSRLVLQKHPSCIIQILRTLSLSLTRGIFFLLYAHLPYATQKRDLLRQMLRQWRTYFLSRTQTSTSSSSVAVSCERRMAARAPVGDVVCVVF